MSTCRICVQRGAIQRIQPAERLWTLWRAMDAVDGLQAVGEMLRGEHACTMLLQRCFNDAWGQRQYKLLRTFKGKVHRKRWGIVAFATKKILKFREPLTRGWCYATYMVGSSNAVAWPARRPDVGKRPRYSIP